MLEDPNIVTLDHAVDVSAVMTASEYWRAEHGTEEHAQWLCRLLPKVRTFLNRHAHHEVVYRQEEYFYEDLDWLEEEDHSGRPELTLRWLVERMGITEWEQALTIVTAADRVDRPFWFEYGEPSDIEQAKIAFAKIIEDRKSN